MQRSMAPTSAQVLDPKPTDLLRLSLMEETTEVSVPLPTKGLNLERINVQYWFKGWRLPLCFCEVISVWILPVAQREESYAIKTDYNDSWYMLCQHGAAFPTHRPKFKV